MSRVVYPPRWAFWIIRSFYWVFKILGLATISLHTNPKNKRPLSFTSSKLGIFYNVLFGCSIVAVSYVMLPKVLTLGYTNKSVTTSFIVTARVMFGIVTMCTILLCYVFRSSTVEIVCNYLVQVEEKFRFSETSISMTRTFWNLLMVFAIQITLYGTALLLQCLAFHIGPLELTMISLPSIGNNMYLQYISVISLVRANFSRVNDSIRTLCKNLKTNDCWNSKNRCRAVVNNSVTVQTIRHLRNIHDDLCDICGMISQFYSFPCLLLVAFTFYVLVFNSYYILLPVIVPDKDYDVLVFLSVAAIIFRELFPFGVLASKITDLMNESERTAIVVQSFLKIATDRETKSELKQFSLQLLSRRIRFTIGGYFDLDNSLFQSMLSTVVTYLVILIQYEVGNSSVHVCNCNCTRA